MPGKTINHNSPTLYTLKKKLARVMRVKGMGKSDLAKLLRWDEKQVDRALDLGHASRLDRLDYAFLNLGYEVDVKVVRARPRKMTGAR